ncbi:hypothetical protein MAPG_09264, partial [Magnaporthiopsis poae ATCC 64411]
TAHIDEQAAAKMAAAHVDRRKGLRMPSDDEEDAEKREREAATREDRERRDKDKEERAKAVEAERVALAMLQRVPPVEKETTVAASSAIEINEFIGVSTTGTRKTSRGV